MPKRKSVLGKKTRDAKRKAGFRSSQESEDQAESIERDRLRKSRARANKDECTLQQHREQDRERKSDIRAKLNDDIKQDLRDRDKIRKSTVRASADEHTKTNLREQDQLRKSQQRAMEEEIMKKERREQDKLRKQRPLAAEELDQSKIAKNMEKEPSDHNQDDTLEHRDCQVLSRRVRRGADQTHSRSLKRKVHESNEGNERKHVDENNNYISQSDELQRTLSQDNFLLVHTNNAGDVHDGMDLQWNEPCTSAHAEERDELSKKRKLQDCTTPHDCLLLINEDNYLSQKNVHEPVGNKESKETVHHNENLTENQGDIQDPCINDSERITLIRQELISKQSDGDFTYNMFEDNPLMEAGREFYEELENTPWNTCVNCHETWMMKVGVRSNKCNRCSGTRAPIFGDENDLNPGDAPEVLTRLSPIEKSAISIICPNICIYKGGITSSSSKGHCVSFYQDVQTLATCLPRLPADLNIIVIKNPNDKITDKTFTVRKEYILNALQFLQSNSPDYKDITIEQANIDAYPEHGILQNVRQINPEDVKLPEEEATAENPESVGFNTTTVAMNIPTNTVKENISEVIGTATENVQSNLVQEAHHQTDQPEQHQPQQPHQQPQQEEPLPWPQRQNEAASEFTPGFFSKAFPDLFPYGMGDITKPRKYKNPSLLEYFQHLMRINRHFVTHHSFAFVATNMWRRHHALTLGNVFTKASADGLSMNDLKNAVEKGEDAVIKKLLYFAAPIVGTRQNLRYKSDLALSFLDFVRIESDDSQMFDMFQTFSAADLHWDDMHRMFPESEQYLKKIVVKSVNDIPPDEDPNMYIDAASDFKLRSAAVRDNADIVAAYLKHRHSTFMDTVMKKLGQEEYIIRYEDQGRGCLHTHDLLVMKNGVSAQNLKDAYSKVDIEVVVGMDVENYTKVTEAKNKVIDFSTKTLGVSATHPNPDPAQWPDEQMCIHHLPTVYAIAF